MKYNSLIARLANCLSKHQSHEVFMLGLGGNP